VGLYQPASGLEIEKVKKAHTVED